MCLNNFIKIKYNVDNLSDVNDGADAVHPPHTRPMAVTDQGASRGGSSVPKDQQTKKAWLFI